MPLVSAGVWFDDGPGTAPRQQTPIPRRCCFSMPDPAAIIATFLEIEIFWQSKATSYVPRRPLPVQRTANFSSSLETDIEPDIAEEMLWQGHNVSYHPQARRPVLRRDIDSHNLFDVLVRGELPENVTVALYQHAPSRPIRSPRQPLQPCPAAVLAYVEVIDPGQIAFDPRYITFQGQATAPLPHARPVAHQMSSMRIVSSEITQNQDDFVFPELWVQIHGPVIHRRPTRSFDSGWHLPPVTPDELPTPMAWVGQSVSYQPRPERFRHARDSSLPADFADWGTYEFSCLLSQSARPVMYPRRPIQPETAFPFQSALTSFELGLWGEWQGQSVRPVLARPRATEARVSQEGPPLEDFILDVVWSQVTQRPVPAPRAGQNQQIFAAPSWVEAGIVIVAGPYCVAAGDIYVAGPVIGDVACD